MSEETKKKLSAVLMGREGRPISKDNREKINKALKGRKMPPCSDDKKRKISEKLKGRKFSQETLDKMSKTHLERWINKLHKNRDKNEEENCVDRKEKKKFQNIRYKVSKRNAEGTHTFGDWDRLKAQYNWSCPRCRKKEPDIKLTEDHIIPLSIGGSDNIENIQPLCRSCNSWKHTKIIKYSQEGELILPTEEKE